MSFKVIIPARYQSTRLPGKPLLDIAGKPMIQRVYEAACRSDAQEVIIATDDQRISDACKKFDAKVCMTSKTHQSGTDRLHEVVQALGFSKEEVVVNVQGDEPLIAPSLINQVANNLLLCQWASIASLCEKITEIESVFNPNNVKVVFDVNNEALYFSRAPIPWQRDLIKYQAQSELKHVYTISQDGINLENYFRHIGIYAYRTDFLHQFVKWLPAKMELLESLEQLRALANGHRIHIAEACEAVAPGVDTQADLEKIRKIFVKS